MSGSVTPRGFAITIKAVDQTTGTLDRINRGLASMRAPVDRMSKSFATLGDLTGMTKAAKGLGALNRMALGVAKSVGGIGGLTAKLGSVGSVAGVVALENSFARMGQTLTNNSKLLGLAPSQLAKFENALNLQTGVSAETTASGLRSMQMTAADAAFGQNGQAATYLQASLGSNWRTLSQDPRTEYTALSKWFQTFTGPYRQVAIEKAASAVGMPEDLVPAAMQGPKALQVALDQAKKLGSPSDQQINDATTLARNLRAADQAVTNLGTTISDKLSGAADAFTKKITGWTVAANGFISTKVGNHLDDINKALNDTQSPLDAVIDTLTSQSVMNIAVPWIALGTAIGDLAGSGPKSFGRLGLALSAIGFGVVADQIVKRAAKAMGASDASAESAGNAAQDIVTGAGLGGSIAGPVGAAAGAALGAMYWGLTDPAAVPVSPKLAPDIATEVKQDAAKYGVPESFALAQFRAEGGGYKNVSGAGAFGPAQLMPGTAKMMGVATSVDDPAYDWRANVDAGMRYDALLMRHYNKQLGLVAAGYNQGPTATDKWLAAGHQVSALNNQTAHYVKQIEANGGIPLMPQVAPTGNLGFAFTPSKGDDHPDEYRSAITGQWRPLTEPDAPPAVHSRPLTEPIVPPAIQIMQPPRRDEGPGHDDRDRRRPFTKPEPPTPVPVIKLARQEDDDLRSPRPAGGGDGPGQERMHIVIENIHTGDGQVKSRVKSAPKGVKTTIHTTQPTTATAIPGGYY